MKSGSWSYVYPHEPSPLHFTQLYSPMPTVFMPSPATYIKPGRNKCAGLCSLLVAAGALIGTTAFVARLVLKPISAPHYTIDTIKFNPLQLLTPNDTLTADADYTITATNPNRKLGFRYDRVDFETSYQGIVFGRRTVTTFYQDHQNVTTLTSGFAVEKLPFASSQLASAIAADVDIGIVRLHLRGSAKARVNVGVIMFFPVNVFVDCDFVVMNPNLGANPGSVTNMTCTL